MGVSCSSKGTAVESSYQGSVSVEEFTPRQCQCWRIHSRAVSMLAPHTAVHTFLWLNMSTSPEVSTILKVRLYSLGTGNQNKKNIITEPEDIFGDHRNLWTPIKEMVFILEHCARTFQ